MTTPIPHVTDMGEFVYGRVERISPLVRRVVCENPNHFTYRGTATFLVGNGDVAVIDPGPMHPPHLDALLGALEPGEKLSSILITHTHADHSPAGAELAARTGATTFGFGPHGATRSDEANTTLVDFSAHLAEEDIANIKAAMDAIPDHLRRESVDTAFVPDVRLADGDVVEGDGWTIQAVWTPGHCSNHLCYSLSEESTLFSGDHVMGWSTSVISQPDGSMGDYLDSLRRLLGRAEATYRPTHGPPITDPRRYVEALLAHRLEREAEILAQLEAGVGRISDMVANIYAAHDRILWFPAAASVHSHLLKLAGEGRVESDRLDDHGAPAIDATYQLA